MLTPSIIAVFFGRYPHVNGVALGVESAYCCALRAPPGTLQRQAQNLKREAQTPQRGVNDGGGGGFGTADFWVLVQVRFWFRLHQTEQLLVGA